MHRTSFAIRLKYLLKFLYLISALPPPEPPKFTSVFQPIRNLLQCDLMMEIMHLILQRSVATRSRSWSEAQLDRLLHLIGLALHEQKRCIMAGNFSFDFIARATKGILGLHLHIYGIFCFSSYEKWKFDVLFTGPEDKSERSFSAPEPKAQVHYCSDDFYPIFIGNPIFWIPETDNSNGVPILCRIAFSSLSFRFFVRLKLF